jgi:hypothetical protein
MMPDPTDERAEQLLAMTQRLIGLLEEEIEALRTRRLDARSISFEEKERLVHAWRLEVSRIKADPALLAGLWAARREQLQTAARALEDKLSGHEQALAAARAVTEGLVRSIAAEIADARSGPEAYSARGLSAGGARREASGLAVNARV